MRGKARDDYDTRGHIGVKISIAKTARFILRVASMLPPMPAITVAL